MQLELSFVSEPEPSYGEILIRGPKKIRKFSYLKRNVPRLIIEGKWLTQIGVTVGHPVNIEYYQNRIVIKL